jgi:hypothetical protein
MRRARSQISSTRGPRESKRSGGAENLADKETPIQNLESSVPPTRKLVSLSRGPDALGGVDRIRMGGP